MQVDKLSNKALYLIAFVFYVVLFFLSKGLPYFWDTVLFSSRVPQHFFQNGLGNLIAPDTIDSGHPPFYPLLHASAWKLFGQSLWVGHALTACFSILLATQWIQLCRKWLPTSFVWLGLLFLLLEPTLLAQSALVSPEIPLIAFTLWALNSLLDKKYGLATLALSLLVLTSTRGAVWVFILFLFQAFAHFKLERKNISIKLIAPFVLPVLIELAWLGYHYGQVGWLALNPNGNWAKYTANAALSDIPFNLAALTHRFLDFGRGMMVLVLVLLVLRYRQSKKVRLLESLGKEQKLCWALFFIGLFVLGTLGVIKTYSTQHRYYITLYLLVAMGSLQLLYKLKDIRLRNLFVSLSAVALVVGHGLIYPQNIAQGWDSSLAFLHGIKAKNVVEKAMKEKGIPKEDVATVFPFRHSDQRLYLNGDEAAYLNYWADKEPNYILWSHICNDFPDELIGKLDAEWNELASNCSGNVCVKLFQRPVSP